MSKFDYTSLLVLDAKHTMWESPKPPEGQRSEIVRIDIAVIDTEKNSIKECEQIHICPENSKVSGYCKQYFGLNLEKIEKGISFKEAYRHLRIHYMAKDRLWASWGDVEKGLLDYECQMYGLESLLTQPSFDIRHNYSLMLGLDKIVNLADARRFLDIQYSENDAVSIGQVFIRIASGLRPQKTRILVHNKGN